MEAVIPTHVVQDALGSRKVWRIIGNDDYSLSVRLLSFSKIASALTLVHAINFRPLDALLLLRGVSRIFTHTVK